MKNYTLCLTEKQFGIVRDSLLHCLDKPHYPLLGSEVQSLSDLLDGAQADDTGHADSDDEFFAVIIGDSPIMIAAGRSEEEAWEDACVLGQTTRAALREEGHTVHQITGEQYEAVCRGELDVSTFFGIYDEAEKLVGVGVSEIDAWDRAQYLATRDGRGTVDSERHAVEEITVEQYIAAK